MLSTIHIRLLYSHRLVRKPEPSSNQPMHTALRQLLPRAGVAARPYTENFSNPNGFLSDGMFICTKPAFTRCVVECGVGVPQGGPKGALRYKKANRPPA